VTRDIDATKTRYNVLSEDL